VAERDLLASLSLGIFWYCLDREEELLVNFLRTRSAALGHGRVLSLSGAGWGGQSWVSVCDQAWLRLANE